MYLPDLPTVVDLVRQKLSRYTDVLRGNEWFTRYVLIDPLLRALGWITDDPELVHVEYLIGDRLRGKSADYALMDGRGKPRVFIEAKMLGARLEGAVEQCVGCIEMCEGAGVCSFIVTDGRKYEGYDFEPKAGQRPKKMTECDIL